MNYGEYVRQNKFYIFVCPTRERESHTHEFLELAYVRRGSAIHSWNQTETRIREGDYFVIDYESRHSYRALTEEFELINCLFMPELIDPALKNCRSFQTVVSSYQIHFRDGLFTANPSASTFRDDSGAVRTLLTAMLEEYSGQAPGFLQIIRSKLIELLVITMRKICLDQRTDTVDRDIDRLVRYISTEYAGDIRLKEICREFNYSFSYMSMKFKKTLGLTYMEFLQKTRVEQSMRLLAGTDKPVEEIARAVGYRDIKSFYTAFKRFAGTTPAKFRQNYNG